MGHMGIGNKNRQLDELHFPTTKQIRNHKKKDLLASTVFYSASWVTSWFTEDGIWNSSETRLQVFFPQKRMMSVYYPFIRNRNWVFQNVKNKNIMSCSIIKQPTLTIGIENTNLYLKWGEKSFYWVSGIIYCYQNYL